MNRKRWLSLTNHRHLLVCIKMYLCTFLSGLSHLSRCWVSPPRPCTEIPARRSTGGRSSCELQAGDQRCNLTDWLTDWQVWLFHLASEGKWEAQRKCHRLRSLVSIIAVCACVCGWVIRTETTGLFFTKLCSETWLINHSWLVFCTLLLYFSLK